MRRSRVVESDVYGAAWGTLRACLRESLLQNLFAVFLLIFLSRENVTAFSFLAPRSTSLSLSDIALGSGGGGVAAPMIPVMMPRRWGYTYCYEVGFLAEFMRVPDPTLHVVEVLRWRSRLSGIGHWSVCYIECVLVRCNERAGPRRCHDAAAARGRGSASPTLGFGPRPVTPASAFAFASALESKNLCLRPEPPRTERAQSSRRR